jgi:large subunit ribosomal protein L10
MDAEYVVAKNSLVLRALEENKIKLEGENPLEGPTGTMLIYGDVVMPLKQLAKTIKELGLLNVKLGIMENKFLTGEQVLKISTLPSREVLLTQIAVGLKSPISGLHRALNWNLQKFVMTLAAIAKNKPAAVVEAPVVEPKAEVEPETILAETPEEKAAEETVVQVAADPEPASSEPAEPETILAETAEEKAEEVPAEPVVEEPAVEAEIKEEIKIEGGEN